MSEARKEGYSVAALRFIRLVRFDGLAEIQVLVLIWKKLMLVCGRQEREIMVDQRLKTEPERVNENDLTMVE